MVEGDKHDNASSSASIREGNVPLQCPKLTDTNYTTWALMMETILKACGLWKVIDGIKENDEKAENTAKGMIFQTLPQDILGGTLKDKVLVRKLLNSVPKKFLPIVASIEQYQELDTMQFEEAVGRITAFEERLKSQDEPEDNYQNKLLLANSSNQGGGKGHGRNFTKNKSSNGEGTSRGSIDKSKLSSGCLVSENFWSAIVCYARPGNVLSIFSVQHLRSCPTLTWHI
ncbi:S-locus glycoprotein domain, Bulb-type lectin domain, Zinc finger, CCHC-type [Artemisia annua]|uniref:S-locus glycoprotein domain, Bulb-type lectin domain, Zinc finger, CCHC-type n=1 Tax=Artemisia annua TaxID=35608 RepID=A0A2U1MJF5_ARTAN|nr:S-locus glycoprotein domain, Bulb-type lectin domain, Zinc finger, CCHC-type [Artemisia annua]